MSLISPTTEMRYRCGSFFFLRGEADVATPTTSPHYFPDSGDLDALYCAPLNYLHVCCHVGLGVGGSCVTSNKGVMDFSVQPSSRAMK